MGTTELHDLARMMGEQGYTIREWREVNRCRGCGHCAWDPDTGRTDDVDDPCPHGCCRVYRCVSCGHYSSGYGAAGCPCDDGI